LEIAQRTHYLPDNKLDTIYFGGGTPSLFSAAELEKILFTINQNFIVKKNAEITIEANPDDLNCNYISDISKLPFNRISIGVQSFNDKELRFLQRRHNAEQAKNAIENCKKSGFKNISIDLIYALPNQTLKNWQNSINEALKIDIQHISAYCLTYEKGTQLYNLDKIRHFSKKSETKSINFFEFLNESLKNANFEHYEISNYCKKNCFSRHNSGYWQGANYLGVGAAAHSFDGNSRCWNVANLEKYCNGIFENKKVFRTEILTKKNKYNELILLSLRTKKGVDLQKLKNLFGNAVYDFLIENSKNYIAQEILKINKNFMKIDEKAFFMSNLIISDLMLV
jgi:oxygen-independent coproporphyrinogen-3 oxidase